MALEQVRFHGIPRVQSAEGSLTVDMRFSDCFKPKSDDVVLLIPVGWTNFTQSRAKLQANGQTTAIFPTDNLVSESPDSTFQLIYVQKGVACGASTPFSIGIPYDDDSLDYDSIDVNTLLINNRATKGRGVQPELELDLETGEHRNNRESNNLQARLEPIPSEKEGETHNDRKSEVQETRELSTVSKFHRSNNELYTSIDDESFVITEMPSSHPETRPGENDLQMMLTQVSRERDEYCKLFRRERIIAQQQEKKHEDLKREYDSTAHENNELKEKLLQTETELKILRESIDLQGTHLVTTKGNSLQVVEIGKKDNNHELGVHGTGESCDDIVRDIIRRPPAYCPPSALLLPSTASLTAGTDLKCPGSTSGIRSKQQVVRRQNSGVWSCGSFHDHETLCCPMCSTIFDDGDHNAFQRHVHIHFRDEES